MPSLPTTIHRIAVAGALALAQAACGASAPNPTEPPTTQPPSTASALDGVYLGLKQNGVDGAISDDYWTFFPDGRVMRYAPDEGLARPIDFARICAHNICGTYERTGDTLRIRWSGAASETVYDMDATGSFAEHGKVQRYRPLAPETGLQIAARYAVIDIVNDITLVRIDFLADGHFTEQNLMTHTFWVQLAPPGETRVALPGGSGTYSIIRNTLALHYDTGETAYFLFVVPPGESAKAIPGSVYINQAHIERVAVPPAL
jgi:hypothetical protein